MKDDTKRRLDKLRDELSRMQGRSLTAQDLLDALVNVGTRRREAVLEELSGIRYPLPASRLKASLAIASDIGNTSEEDIDLTLYGGRRRRR